MLKRTFEGWTDQNHAIAVRMWSEDASGAVISSQLGASRSSVLGYMNRHRDVFPKKTEPSPSSAKNEGKGDVLKWFRWTKDNIDLAVKMYADMESKKTIAEAIGCSVYTAENFFKKNRDIFPLRGYIPVAPKTLAQRKALVQTEHFISDPDQWKPLEHLHNDDCRWIMEGTGAGALFCADTTDIGSSWCSHHGKKVYPARAVA